MLAVCGLAVARGGRPVLDGLSFDVAAGSALILRGPNGVGKTTLLRTLAGLQPPLAGEIDCNAPVAYASHRDGVKPTLTVDETIGFWADLFQRPVPDGVHADFDLASLRNRTGGTLSAGQSRRLGLARLAVTGARLLLLDEPTVSLDRASVARFANWLSRFLGQGGAAIIATHIDLGLEAPTLELAAFAASQDAPGGSDEAFL